MLKSYRFAYVLPLLLALAHPGGADASPSSSSSSHSSPSHSSSSSSSSRASSSSSFKSGFSSQRSSSPATPSYAPSKPSGAPAASSSAGGSARSGGFGSFGRRPAGAAANDAPDAAPAPGRSSGGFGSFGGGRPAPQKSDSALSRELGRKAAEENALRTLDARRQAQADAARDTRPVPGYEQGARRGQDQPVPGYGQPQPQAPVVVRQDSGLGQVVAGAVLANAMRGAHANNNGYPGGYGNTGGHGNAGGRDSHGGGGISFVGLFMTLCVLALLAWGAYFMWRRLRRAREDRKPNYSFREN